MILSVKKNAVSMLIIILVFLSILGIGKIYSFAKNIENNTSAFYASAEKDITGVKINERTQNIAENAVSDILDSGAKSRISRISANGDRIICYMKNVYIELDTVSMRPVLLFYECAKNKPKLNNEECKTMAMTFVLRNIPRKTKVNGCKITEEIGDAGIFSYTVLFGDQKVRISLRADTGSVIYYDASELFRV